MLDLVAPPCCALCARFLALGAGPLCGRCEAETIVPGPPPTPSGLPRFAAAAFEGLVRSAVLDLKFHRAVWRARPLGRLLAARLDTAFGADVVVPVPLHARRLRERGYDQGAEIARGVATGLGVPVSAAALVRRLHAAPQSTRGLAERAVPAGTYAARMAVRGVVLLVDDVTTSGQTLDACAVALLEAGADAVRCAAVAFTPPEPTAGGLLDAARAS